MTRLIIIAYDATTHWPARHDITVTLINEYFYLIICPQPISCAENVHTWVRCQPWSCGLTFLLWKGRNTYMLFCCIFSPCSGDFNFLSVAIFCTVIGMMGAHDLRDPIWEEGGGIMVSYRGLFTVQGTHNTEFSTVHRVDCNLLPVWHYILLLKLVLNPPYTVDES